MSISSTAQSAPPVGTTPRTTSPRRHLSRRQAETVARLAAATVEELRAVGYDGLTVRNVARRAGVAPATAYTYFASKDHLVTEVYWQRLQGLPQPVFDRDRPAADRVADVLSELGLLVADEPELATACTTATLANDPEVSRLRDAISRHAGELLRTALGDDSSPAVLRTLGAAFSGVLLQAGLGQLPYDDVPARLREAAGVILGDRNAPDTLGAPGTADPPPRRRGRASRR